MSTRRESDKTSTRSSAVEDAASVETTTRTTTYSPTPTLSEQRYSVDRALDKTRDNIVKTIDEARRSHVTHKR